jgi:pimeloyl-ACP methyl ester carboxylesterase
MTRRTALWVLGVLSGALGIVLVALDVRMQEAGGWGIVDFELAGSEERSREILEDWGDDGEDAARLSLWLDFPYLALYGAFWFLAVAATRDLAKRCEWRRLAAAGPRVLWLPLAGAALDAVEDAFLLLALGERGGDVAPLAATVCASGKFLALGISIGYVVVALALRLWRRSRAAGVAVLAGIALVVAALAINAVVASGETEAAQARDGGRILDLPGGDLNVVDEGPRGDEAIVLLHGFSASTRWWEPAARILARERRVIRVDLLGHGGSEKPDDGYGMEDQGRLVTRAVRALGVRRAVVAGHSMGGTVAVAATEADPELVRGAVIVDTAPEPGSAKGPGSARLVFVPLLGPAFYELVPDSSVERNLETAFADGVDFPDAFVDDVRELTYRAFTRSLDAGADYREEQSLADRMSAVRRPALVIFGEEDEIADLDGVDDWRDSGFPAIVLEGAGHSPNWELPGETADAVARFADSELGD